MRLFIKKICWFSLIVVLSLVVLTLGNKILFKFIDPFTIDKSVHILILGDSHTKFGLNDKILEHTVNFSNDADSYFYCYSKLKEIHRKNRQIDTMLLSFSSHNIDKRIEETWLFNAYHLYNKLPYFLPFLNSSETAFLLKKKPLETSGSFFKQVFLPKIIFNADIYGGYKNLDHNILAADIEKHRHEPKIDSITLFADNELKYLLKIKQYCYENNIALILIQTPLHKTNTSDYKQLVKFYKTYVNDIPYYDFSKLELADSCFGDLVHLSPAGADIFSNYIKTKGLLQFAEELKTQAR